MYFKSMPSKLLILTAWLGWETLPTIMTSTHALHTSAAMIASGLTVTSGHRCELDVVNLWFL